MTSAGAVVAVVVRPGAANGILQMRPGITAQAFVLRYFLPRRGAYFLTHILTSVVFTMLRYLGQLSAAGTLWLVACALVLPVVAPPECGADEVDFYVAEAEAIAAAVSRVAHSVVQIELIGTAATAAGEVAADAPSAGTVIDPEGLILASSMVTAEPAASILVVLSDGTRLPAEVVANDEGRELVLLRVNPQSPLPAVTIRPVEDVRVGQYAIAVGRLRHDGEPARSVGIVSALGRLEGRALQTDARVSPPFYGGPLINIQGEVLGIVVPAMPELGGSGDKAAWYDAGIAFVAPADQIASRLERMIEGETIRPGKLGTVAGNSDLFADGTTVAAVRVGSPAAEADIQPGDQIVEIEGTAVRRHAEIRQLLGPIDAGSTISVVLDRDGQRVTVTPTLVGEIPPFEPQMFGLWIADSEGLQVTGVFPGSPAEEAGFEVDDVVQAIGESEAESVEQLRKQVMTLRGEQTTTATVLRDGEEVTLEVTPTAIAGTLAGSLPPLPGEPVEGDWSVTELTLPDVANAAVMLAPEEVPEEATLGLLVVFAEPGAKDLKQVAQRWTDAAGEHRVVVGVIGSSDASRWTPEEAELGGRLASLIRNRFAAIDPAAIGATGDGAGATLAIVAALSESSSFGGVAIPGDVQPPAIRLPENDPASPTQLLIRGEKLPPWAGALAKGGYAVVQSGGDAASVVWWVRTLARI